MNLLTFAILYSVLCGSDDFTLAGVVVDKLERPVAAASVWVVQNRRAQRGASDAQGRFQFGGLSVGDVEAVAYKEGHAVGGVTARMAGSAEITIVLRDPGAVPLRILDTGYEPVAGARIESLLINGQQHVSVEDLGPLGLPVRRSDTQGRLTLQPVPKGGFVQFTVAHPQYARTFVPYLSEGRKEQDIVVYPGVKVRGRVTGPGGTGVQHVRVSVFNLTGSGPQSAAEELTDPEGFYSALVGPGEYYVTAAHPSYATPEPKPVSVPPDSAGAVADLTLQPACFATGSVADPQGKPVVAVDVMYIRDKVVYDTTLTQVDGSYRLRVSPGDGWIHIVPPRGYAMLDYADVQLRDIKDKNVSVPAISLQELPVIEGVIHDSDGKPASGVLIESRNLTPVARAISSEEGQFAIRFAQAPQEAVVSFRAEHALRFLRNDFEVNLRELKPVTCALRSYRPEPDKPTPTGPLNKLGHLLDRPAPPWVCDKWANSAPLRLESLRGKVVVLTFWTGFDATGRGGERIEELNYLYRLYQDIPDVTFAGIHDTFSDIEEIERHVRNLGIRYPVAKDSPDAATFDIYDITYIPQTVLIDKKGTLRFDDVDGRLLELIKVLRREAAQ